MKGIATQPEGWVAIPFDTPILREVSVRPEGEPVNESLKAARTPGPLQVPDIDDDTDTAVGIDLPGADLSEEELTIQVIPEREDEFVCDSCFLVHHRSQLARETDSHRYRTDCEG